MLITHTKVACVAVFGVANEEIGKEVKAALQPFDWDVAGGKLASVLLTGRARNLAMWRIELSRFPARVAAW